MDRDFLEKNKPGIERPQQVVGAPPGDELDPTRIWTPQPSGVYDTLDRAADEGNLRPGASALARADAGLEANRAHTDDYTEMQHHPFVAPTREVQHTAGGVKTDLEFDIGLRSGQGQSGFGEPPVILPTRGPEGEVSIIELPTPARQRQGT